MQLLFGICSISGIIDIHVELKKEISCDLSALCFLISSKFVYVWKFFKSRSEFQSRILFFCLYVFIFILTILFSYKICIRRISRWSFYLLSSNFGGPSVWLHSFEMNNTASYSSDNVKIRRWRHLAIYRNTMRQYHQWFGFLVFYEWRIKWTEYLFVNKNEKTSPSPPQ